jgi:phosphoribosylformylglycinamidine synthase PurS subunit
MQYEVVVELKGEVLDAEGRAIKETLQRQSYSTVKDVKVSKRFVVSVDGDEAGAQKAVDKIAHEFLANPVSEIYTIRKL